MLGILWFVTLHLRTLTEPDEGRYAEIPREMLAGGDWLAPHLNGIQYLEKPPLQYWATAALFATLGLHDWVSRLWTAGLGFALVWLLWRVGRRWYDEETGQFAALILGSSLLYYAMGHVNTLDMGLTFFLTAALLAFIEAQRADRPRRFLWITWTLLGLAVLQKGLVGLALPAFSLCLYLVVQRDWQLLRRLGLKSGMAIVLAINLPWWWLMQRRNPGFFDWFFVHEHYTRFTTTAHGRSQPWWYFSAVLMLGLLPWLAATARGAIAGWRTTASGFAGERLLVLAAAAVFIFYSPSGSKLSPYILPMLPPLALLAGHALARSPSIARALRSTWACAALMAAALLSLPLVRHRIEAPPGRAGGYTQIADWGFAAGMVMTLAIAASVWLGKQAGRARSGPAQVTGRRCNAVAVLALGATAAAALLAQGSNAIDAWLGNTAIAAAVAGQIDARTPIYCVDIYPQTVFFRISRTCIVAGQKGELEVQFDDGEPSYLASVEDFLAAWQRQPAAVAIIATATWQRLRSEQLPATVAFANDTAVVIVKRRPGTEVNGYGLERGLCGGTEPCR